MENNPLHPYDQIEKEIEEAKTIEDINNLRVRIQNYTRTRGGNENVIKQGNMLSNLLNVKEKDILKGRV